MSLITLNRAIVASIWPNGLGRVTPQVRDLQVRDSWRFVPEDYDDLYDWATVIDDQQESGDGRLVKHLVYDHTVLPDGGDDAVYEVTLLLQGFVGDLAIGVLGNWRGDERDAPQAIQFMKLESGGVEDVFSAQRRALADILSLIHTQTGGEPRHSEDDNSIMLRRGVFTKVRPTGTRASPVQLTDVNDPFKNARRISSRWRVDHIIETCVRRPNGSNIRVSPDAIRKGDFVEVAVTAQIRTIISRKRRQTVVEFAMHEVVRLWSAREAREKYVRTDTENAATGTGRVPLVIRTGIVPGPGAMGEGVGVGGGGGGHHERMEQ